MGQRPNMTGTSVPSNAYVGQQIRTGGPGVNPQNIGPMKRPSDVRTSTNQPGKMYVETVFFLFFILCYHVS